ncbi:MAG: CDP-glycerol glycerophosphotransferase family protein, partial [Parachlamydiaceae bacterium]|nr:CDP-glycerol glycerophosphotransferase family protein [Parachlamydiaceae bacterium]
MTTAWNKKGIGLNPASQIHYIDHLAVVCILMEIPLLFLEENDLLLGKKYYPGLEAVLNPYSDFSPEYLISHFDVSFMSDLWDRCVMQEKYSALEEQYNKRWRNVHCPHGFSDKGFYLAKCAMEDIALLYGDNMIDQLKDFGVWENLRNYVITGNYRYTYFKKNRDFYDSVFEKEIQSQFAKKQPIILYAPTWLDLENSTTFFDNYHQILGKLPDDYNLIIKLHPRLELDDVVTYYQIMGLYEKKPNVFFLKDYPLVFPLLAHAAMYIGDMSSVGYDFLAFNKPLFFLNKQNRDSESDRGLFLFRCGTVIP